MDRAELTVNAKLGTVSALVDNHHYDQEEGAGEQRQAHSHRDLLNTQSISQTICALWRHILIWADTKRAIPQRCDSPGSRSHPSPTCWWDLEESIHGHCFNKYDISVVEWVEYEWDLLGLTSGTSMVQNEHTQHLKRLQSNVEHALFTAIYHTFIWRTMDKKVPTFLKEETVPCCMACFQ